MSVLFYVVDLISALIIFIASTASEKLEFYCCVAKTTRT